MQLQQATQKIRMVLLNGKHMTSAEMNSLGKTVDSRKIVSRLKKKGMPIGGYWCRAKEGHRYKRYYLEGQGLPDNKTN